MANLQPKNSVQSKKGNIVKQNSVYSFVFEKVFKYHVKERPLAA